MKDSPKTVAAVSVPQPEAVAVVSMLQPEVVEAVSMPQPGVVAAVSMPQPEAAAACLSELDKVRPSLQDLRTVAAHSRFVICTNMSIPGIIVNRYKSIRKNRRNNDCA